MGRYLLLAAIIFWGPPLLGVSDITNTRHNLSSTGPGTVKSGTVGEICIFCHTPHSSSSDAPLWNRDLPSGQSYQLYGSTTLDGSPGDPQLRAGNLSLLCLSCHDGVIALGDFVNPSQEDLGFTFGAGRGNLTTDLSDDHPFSFVYNNSLATTDGLLVQPGVNGAAIAPLPLSSGDYVECTTCHDVHDNTLPPFLHVQSLNGDICLTCHDATALGFTNSTHGTSTETGAGGTPWSDRRSEWAGANVAENSCMNCHKPHNAPTPIRLLKGAEEATCYSCHNSSTTNISDIQTDAAKAHSHPIDAISGEHDIERLENTAPSTIHAECQDCHDPHTVETPLNPMVTLDSAGNAVAPGHTGEANSRIQGVLGTEDGVNFSTIVNGDPQYKLCYKCHGLSGKGPCPGSLNADERCSAVNDSILTGGNTMDKRVDRVYNIREKFIGSYQAPPEGNDTGTPGYSFHPIEENNPANDSVIASLKTGLDASTTIIYCTDCHNSDVSAAGDGTGAEGPHGSVNGGIMARNYSLEIDVSQPTANDFAVCYKCHDQAVIESDVWGFPHNAHVNARGGGCVLCHDPHGSRFRPRLINFWWEDPAISREGIDCETRDRKTGLCDYTEGFSPRWDYNGTVGNGGSCLLACHGTGHAPKSY